MTATNPFSKRGRSYAYLLKNDKVRDFADSFNAKSTADGIMYALQFFLEFSGLTVSKFLRLSKAKKKSLFRKAVQHKRRKGYIASANRIFNAVNQFAEYNDKGVS